MIAPPDGRAGTAAAAGQAQPPRAPRRQIMAAGRFAVRWLSAGGWHRAGLFARGTHDEPAI